MNLPTILLLTKWLCFHNDYLKHEFPEMEWLEGNSNAHFLHARMKKAWILYQEFIAVLTMYLHLSLKCFYEDGPMHNPDLKLYCQCQ